MCDLTKPYAQCRCERHKAIRARLKNRRMLGYDTRTTADATGTRRRIQALMCLGYSLREQAKLVGCGPMALSWIVTGQHANVTRKLALDVAAMYRERMTMPMPESRAASRARNTARLKGWHSPMIWEDIDNPNEVPDVRADRDWAPIFRSHFEDGLSWDEAARLHGLADGAGARSAWSKRQRRKAA